MPDYIYEAEQGPDAPEGRQGMDSLAKAVSYIAESPSGVIYISRTDWVDERPWIRWVSLDHGHVDGQSESEILQTIQSKFAEQLQESIADNETKPLV